MTRPTVRTRRQTLAQVLVCVGCCCGRTDKGKPDVPVDWLKAEWKRRALQKHVHLSISGCLGPCEIANILCVVTPSETRWFGDIEGRHYYEAVLEWATACADARALRPIPALLGAQRFERYVTSPSETMSGAIV